MRFPIHLLWYNKRPARGLFRYHWWRWRESVLLFFSLRYTCGKNSRTPPRSRIAFGQSSHAYRPSKARPVVYRSVRFPIHLPNTIKPLSGFDVYLVEHNDPIANFPCRDPGIRCGKAFRVRTPWFRIVLRKIGYSFGRAEYRGFSLTRTWVSCSSEWSANLYVVWGCLIEVCWVITSVPYSDLSNLIGKLSTGTGTQHHFDSISLEFTGLAKVIPIRLA